MKRETKARICHRAMEVIHRHLSWRRDVGRRVGAWIVTSTFPPHPLAMLYRRIYAKWCELTLIDPSRRGQ